MINFSFTISPFVKSELDDIDKLRVKTLITLLPPSTEFSLQYEAALARISTVLSLTEQPTRPDRIKKILLAREHKLTIEELRIVTLQRIFAKLYLDWFMNGNSLTFNTLHELNSRFKDHSLSKRQKDLQLILNFIQANPEHPVIQAALARILIYQTLGNNPTSTLLSIITSWIFLLKYGYDFKKMLVLEEEVSRHPTSFTDTMDIALTSHNLSSFLEYYTHSVLIQAEKVSKTYRERSKYKEQLLIQIQLTQRQKEILAFLENPSITISNRQVQKMFGISQITASRDLASLAQYGLIYAIGKGRSVVYSILQ
jgi:hypothetical protein